MEKASIVDRRGTNYSFIGACSYHVKTNWFGCCTVYGGGIPVAFFFRPISVFCGLASPEEIENARDAKDAHDAKMLGVKL